MTPQTHNQTRFQLALALTAAVALLAAVPAAQGASLCAERLSFDDLYDCEFRDETGARVDGLIAFEPLANDTFTATVDLAGVVSVGYCTCKTRFSSTPQFGASREMECLTDFADGAVESMEGVVSGNGRKISKGQVWSVNAAAGSFLRLTFSCRQDRSGDDEGEDGEDGEDGEGDESGAEPLGARVQPSNWSMKWLDKDKGDVAVTVRGAGFDEIDPATVVLVGTDPAAAPLAPASVDWQGNQLRARFGRGDAISTLDDPQPGETHTVAIEFELAGVPTALTAQVRVGK